MYNHGKIDKKWQDFWYSNELFRAEDQDDKAKYYCLDMFPYPSGAGLHVGHPLGYIASDIVSRYKRMSGYNVLHPIGWDAFGLPAENYAIKAGVHPAKSTSDNIKNFKRQIKMLGFSYDWQREINTSDPAYYKWTQWLFLQLYKNGLAYKGKAPVNWCANCQTVLANEQVENGKCERCKNLVIQKELEQWFFKITAYADQLIEDLEQLDWSDSLKIIQKNWIGKSTGGEIEFLVKDHDLQIKVFTTRPDTLFGATYLVLAPEHPVLETITAPEYQESVRKYQQAARTKSELERTELAKDKTGEFTGAYAINPATLEAIPIYTADYVLGGYGTGAIMAVPAHDQRDFEFAKKYQLTIREVISAPDAVEPYTGAGVMINSGEFDGLNNDDAGQKILKKVKGRQATRYRLRDWLVSRQRYWGAPIPIIYCAKCGVVTVPEKDLPVLLPDDVDFRPTGESPLARSEKFHQIKCPTCLGPARRESDTMDTFVCSSWYFLRYPDPKNDQEVFEKKKIKYWMPVDLYIGGAEHAAGHLIFSRFFTKFLRDQRFVNFDEPFKKLVNQGLILAEDGRKMSKSLGNVINPDEVVSEYGADSLRMYEMFMGPLEDAKPWNTKGIKGVRRFLDRVGKWLTTAKLTDTAPETVDLISLNKLIKKITDDIDHFSFNTAVSAFMIFLNDWESRVEVPKIIAETFIKLLNPFAPHLTEELWQILGNQKSLTWETWPQFDPKLIADDNVTLIIQINGKLRDKILVDAQKPREEVLALVKIQPKVAAYLKDKNIRQEVFVPGRLVNFVVD